MDRMRQASWFRTNRDESGRVLSAAEQEKLLKPYLPSAPKKEAHQQGRLRRTSRVRPAIRQLLHYTLFAIIHAVFSIYIRLRQVYHAIVDRILAVLYYHHRTPELIKNDVKNLSKVPNHLSVVLELPPEGGKKDRMETLINDACEVAAWSACAGVPMLSIYEKTGKHALAPLRSSHLTSPQASSNPPSRTSTAV